MEEKGGQIKERRGRGKGDRGKIQEEEAGAGEMRVKIFENAPTWSEARITKDDAVLVAAGGVQRACGAEGGEGLEI
jgi:hypothetical protein